MSQLEFNLDANAAKRYRAIILTTTAAAMAAFSRLAPGETTDVEFVNDIVSTTKGEREGPHTETRRVAMLNRALVGGHRRVYVRSRMGDKRPAMVERMTAASEDACTGAVTLKRI